MNYMKALMGLTLFVSINTFAMNIDDDNNQTYAIDDTNAQSGGYQDIVYHLYCSMCNEFVRDSSENKKVFHSQCLKTVADCDYVKANPITAPEPEKETTEQLKTVADYKTVKDDPIIAPEPWKETTRQFEPRYTAFKSYKRRMKKKNQPK